MVATGNLEHGGRDRHGGRGTDRGDSGMDRGDSWGPDRPGPDRPGPDRRGPGGQGPDGHARPGERSGDRPCLDFVNTYRADPARPYGTPYRGDRLSGPTELARWLWQAGLVPSRVPISHALYERALELRDAIDAGVDAVVAGVAVPATTVDVVNAWMERAERPVLSIEGGTPVLRRHAPSDFAAAALSQIAIDAARLLGTEQRARVRVCAGGCGTRFYDRSPAGRRRWCSMRRCGNAAKARRFRARG